MTPPVVLFTGWPELGRATTRLIPMLGADGAVALHGQLTERVLGAMRDSALPREVRATGTPLAQFHERAGERPVLVAQGDGDLGIWLLRAAEPPVVLIGADIPDLSA